MPSYLSAAIVASERSSAPGWMPSKTCTPTPSALARAYS
jgi:hypothetical protein